MEPAPSVADEWPSSVDDFECVSSPVDVVSCADRPDLGATYAYLLGLYLGDGCISRARRGVWRLRIFQDSRYVRLIHECAAAVASIGGRVPGLVDRPGCVEITSYWKHWPCVFPQHGPGRKHERPIALRRWQRDVVDRHPRELLRGLIHSDGTRTVNRVRRRTTGGDREYAYVRYFFSNASNDIRGLFSATCARVGIDCRPTTERMISVARRESVLMLDEFVGPKS